MPPLQKSRFKLLIVIICLAIFTVLLLQKQALYNASLQESLISIKEKIERLNNISPFYFTLSLAVLPAIGVPMSILCIAAGVTYGTTDTIIFGIIGLCINISFTYWLAAYPLHKVIRKLIRRFRDKHTKLSRLHSYQAILLVRVTPGIPLFIQNYTLGLARVPIKKYFLISLPIQFLWLTGFAILGESLYSLHLEYIAGAIALLIALNIGKSQIKKIKTHEK